jgi:ABC-type branched-subunit amino acid transport system ATPase component
MGAPETDMEGSSGAPSAAPGRDATAVAEVAPLLEAREVSVRFGGVAALSAVSLGFFPGQIRGLIGPNGAGKTTLFDVLAGQRRPSTGSVYFDGQDITGRSPTWRSRQGIRRTFQRQQTFGWLSVEDNLVVAMEWKGGGGGMVADLVHWPKRRQIEKVRRQRAAEVIELCHLGDIAHVAAGKLAIGSARMIELARAIVDHPKALLLDEPTSGLREEEAERFGRTVREIVSEENCAVVLVEHDMQFVMGHCDHIAVLNLGEVIADGTPAEIQADPVVGAAYLG